MILRSLQISGLGPVGFSRQYATQHDIPSKVIVIYVQGGWLSSFVIKVTSTRFELNDDFSSLDVRICPESLVEHVCITMLPLTFHFTLEVPKGKKTIFLLRSTTSQQIHASSLAGGWDISPWSKWISLRTSLDFQDPQTSWDLLERPHRQRLDFSLEPWQICKLLGIFYCPILK